MSSVYIKTTTRQVQLQVTLPDESRKGIACSLFWFLNNAKNLVAMTNKFNNPNNIWLQSLKTSFFKVKMLGLCPSLSAVHKAKWLKQKWVSYSTDTPLFPGQYLQALSTQLLSSLPLWVWLQTAAAFALLPVSASVFWTPSLSLLPTSASVRF